MLTTRYSLIARLEDPRDDEAWNSFVQLYYPVIYRSLRRRGVQDADAADLAQQVFLSVSRALARRPHDPNRARFRTWLETIIRNVAIDSLRSAGVRPMPTDQADQWQDPSQSITQLWEDEYRRQLFVVAAETVRCEFEPKTWQAFWKTAVEGIPVGQVADQLKLQKGSVYAAKSRVVRRLQLEIENLLKNSESVSESES